MATVLEHYVINVMQLSSQGNFSQLCDFVSKNYDTLFKNAGALDTVLDTLDPEQHSIGALAVILVKYQQYTGGFETLYAQTQRFINVCNAEHIRYAADSFAELCLRLTNILIELKCPARGILLLSTAIDKLQTSSAQLTSIHADLCQLCLAAKNLKPALKYLTADITDIHREGGQYEARHLLLYCYYGGLVFAALKMYEKAIVMFEVAVSMPAMAVSHIMLEAYKKYLLVGLLLHGKMPVLPKYCSATVNRFIKPLSQAYHDLVTAFATNSPAEVRKVVEKHTEQYQRDSNIGLVRQCATSIHKKNIQRLTKTFVTLSLVDVANRAQTASPREAEEHVLHMIEDREIYAAINQKDGMVEFHDNPEKYNNPHMMILLEQEISICVRLSEKLKEMEREICVNPEYVKKVSGLNESEASAAIAVASSSTGTGGRAGYSGSKTPSFGTQFM